MTDTQIKRVIALLQETDNLNDFKSYVVFAEKILKDAGYISTVIPNFENLKKEFKKLSDSKVTRCLFNYNSSTQSYDQKVKIRTYVNAGYAGDWTDVDTYSLWGFEMLIKWLETHNK